MNLKDRGSESCEGLRTETAQGNIPQLSWGYMIVKLFEGYGTAISSTSTNYGHGPELEVFKLHWRVVGWSWEAQTP